MQTEAKAKQRDLEAGEVVTVLQREKKKRVEAAEAFEAAGHDDRAQAERSQAAMLDTYLPEQLSDAELDALVGQAVAESGAAGPSGMGAVMKAAMARTGGQADGRRVSAKAKELLT